jgi:hypothetical protein
MAGGEMTTDVWLSNLNTIGNRWPKVAARLAATELKHAKVENDTLYYRGLQVTSAYDKNGEALAQFKREENPKRCYGIGMGALPWLCASKGPVTVVLPNLEIARASLSHSMHGWLHNPSLTVEVADAVEWNDEPWVAVAMECWLADPQGYEIRDRVFIKIHESGNLRRLHDDRERITEQVKTNQARAEHAASAFYGLALKGHVVVVGAGPTLTEQIPWLKEKVWRHIITVPAALRPLLNAGIDLKFCQVVIMENGTSNVGYLDGLDMSKLRKTSLCYNPEADPKFLEMWPGPKCHIHDLWLAGTVLHSCADLATKMGATEVTLVGFDACMPGGKQYADGAGVPGEGYADTPFRMWAVDGHGGQVQIQPRMGNWARGMEDLIKGRPLVKFYKRGRDGVTIKGCEWQD